MNLIAILNNPPKIPQITNTPEISMVCHVRAAIFRSHVTHHHKQAIIEKKDPQI